MCWMQDWGFATLLSRSGPSPGVREKGSESLPCSRARGPVSVCESGVAKCEKGVANQNVSMLSRFATMLSRAGPGLGM